jgi:hypothetical protein
MPGLPLDIALGFAIGLSLGLLGGGGSILTVPALVYLVGQSPQAAVTWQALRLSGQDALAVRASKKLRSDELLLPVFAATRLRMELDRVPLWSGDHVPIKQLLDYFARYPYLPRLKDTSVLLHAIHDGLGLLTWEQDSFAFADSFDESLGRYRGLRGGQRVSLLNPDAGLLVKPEVARKQIPEVWLNPGAESDALVAKARSLSIRPIVACSIVAVGQNPYAL